MLAAGHGLRMRPLTEHCPKPAIPFLNRPILHWLFDSLRSAGVERVFVNLHHLPQAVMSAAEGGAAGLDVRFSFEPQILGTAGVFGPLRGLIQGDALLVVNGDIVHDIPYARLQADLEAHPDALASLALRGAERPYTPVSADADGRILSFGGGGDWMFTGVYAMRRALLERLPGPGPRELVPDLLRPLLPSGAVRGVACPERWLDLGSPAAFLQASMRALRELAEGGLTPPEGSLLETRDRHPLLRHRSALISRDATLTGPLIAGEGVRVEPRAHVGGSVLLERVRVARGERLEGCVAMATRGWPAPRFREGIDLALILPLGEECPQDGRSATGGRGNSPDVGCFDPTTDPLRAAIGEGRPDLPGLSLS